MVGEQGLVINVDEKPASVCAVDAVVDQNEIVAGDEVVLTAARHLHGVENIFGAMFFEKVILAILRQHVLDDQRALFLGEIDVEDGVVDLLLY